ncbi:cytochrome c [Sulfurovum sp.]|uniref:c-type cytochrome n=1 Tax=Sulfurovum sp. TaxID=1969726 RepID=UPI003563BE2F
MKTTSLKLSALAAGFILAGCGGGSSSTTSTTQISKISGTVPGTLIEAFCVDGSYYKVTSTDNNTNEHPFEIEIPSTVSCSLVMTTNENDEAKKVITQIGVITSDANGTVFRATGDINLGHIPLAMDPSEINDANGDHVSDDILSIQVDGISIEVELENPLDDDDDGLVNVYEDDDNDGIYNRDDDDDDGDKEIDIDNDLDDDGIDNENDVDDDNDGYADTPLPTAYTADAGKLLGSQCAQCHGTNGVSSTEWDSIAGEDELESEIFEDDEPIMSAQAHGYTSEEIILIGNWLKTLKTND